MEVIIFDPLHYLTVLSGALCLLLQIIYKIVQSGSSIHRQVEKAYGS